MLEWNYPDHKWFVGGETNITLNALDRHADGANRNKLAIIWIAEDGSERKLTYYELRQLVANPRAKPAKSHPIIARATFRFPCSLYQL